MTKLFLHYNCKSPPFSLSLFPLPTIATNPPPSETRNQPTADSLFPSSLFHLPTVVFQANSPLSPKSDLQRSPHNFTRGFLVDGVTVQDAHKGNSIKITEDSLLGLKYDPTSIWGYFELHIEQGPVLELVGFPLAVVKGIAGQT
ncbi:hypothetical protein V6Z11_A10G130800 [Gossypium hirsutum]